MKFKKIFLILLVIPQLLTHVASATYNGAGVLPFSYDKYGNAFFLIGQERGPGKVWSDFGGGKKVQDKFHMSMTAARECEEETIGLLGSYETILNQLDKYKEFKTYKINNKSDDYVMYITPIEYNHTIPQRFRQKRFQNEKSLSSDQKEKTDAAWIPVKNIINTIEKAQNVNNVRSISAIGTYLLLRKPFVRTLSIAYKNGVLHDILRKEPKSRSIEDKPYITYHSNMLFKKEAPTLQQKAAKWLDKHLRGQQTTSKQLKSGHERPPILQTGWW